MIIMFPIYLIPLAVALGASWVFSKTSEDVYTILCAGTAIICLIWGFALAPWQLQLLLLLILLGIERIYLRNERRLG
ncbi:hypothetical protein [Microcoleus sp. FACHB-68]|uniref:hypothetical protein n=1 Tax=Microcoleus sp. FACHB-68 TaxID=2692826 RepID=UPI001F5526E4|nr:hypothetical protein [Microcoleus sp. FACHB-68]